jgi:peroxiredoxin
MTRLKLGDTAPDFTIDSINKGMVTLNEFRGHKTLLIFSRYFGRPVCQQEFDELREFLKNHPSLKVIYVNQSLPDYAKKFIEDKDVDFPVITSPKVSGKYELYELYGVGGLGPVKILNLLVKSREAQRLGKKHGTYEGVEIQSPAQFLIDEECKIISAEYGVFNPEKLKRSLKI